MLTLKCGIATMCFVLVLMLGHRVIWVVMSHLSGGVTNWIAIEMLFTKIPLLVGTYVHGLPFDGANLTSFVSRRSILRLTHPTTMKRLPNILSQAPGYVNKLP